jgi:hypothetical protein
MAGPGDDQPGSLAGRREGKRRPDVSDYLTEAMARNSRLLHPRERPILVLRKHPAVLGWNIFLALAVLATAVALPDQIKYVGKNVTVFNITLFRNVEKAAGTADRETVLLSIWLVYGIVFLYLAYKAGAWAVSYFVITDRQMILVAGLGARRYASVPISKVTSWYLRESFEGRILGYKSLVFKADNDDRVVRTIGYVPSPAVEEIAGALSSIPQEAGDEEAFRSWTSGGMRRRVRLIIAVLLVFLLIVLAVAAALVPRIRTELSNEAEIIALIPILIVLITPKN